MLWWGTVIVTLASLFGAWHLLMYGLSAWRQDEGERAFPLSIVTGFWIAVTAVFLLPSGMFFFFYAWGHGGTSPFAFSFPRDDAYWQEFIPNSFDPAVRGLFAHYYPGAVIWLNGLGCIAALLAFRRLTWKPWRWAANSAGHYRGGLPGAKALKTMAGFFFRYVLFTAATAVFFTLCLQTLLYLLAHLTATVFFLLPFLLGFAVLAAMGSGGKDIYDRDGKKIGRLD